MGAPGRWRTSRPPPNLTASYAGGSGVQAPGFPASCARHGAGLATVAPICKPNLAGGASAYARGGRSAPVGASLSVAALRPGGPPCVGMGGRLRRNPQPIWHRSQINPMCTNSTYGRPPGQPSGAQRRARRQPLCCAHSHHGPRGRREQRLHSGRHRRTTGAAVLPRYLRPAARHAPPPRVRCLH